MTVSLSFSFLSWSLLLLLLLLWAACWGLRAGPRQVGAPSRAEGPGDRRLLQCYDIIWYEMIGRLLLVVATTRWYDMTWHDMTWSDLIFALWYRRVLPRPIAATLLQNSIPLWNVLGAVSGCFCRLRREIPVSVKQQFLLRKPWSCNPAAESALHPLIWCSESPSSEGFSSLEGCFVRGHRYPFHRIGWKGRRHGPWPAQPHMY